MTARYLPTSLLLIASLLAGCNDIANMQPNTDPVQVDSTQSVKSNVIEVPGGKMRLVAVTNRPDGPADHYVTWDAEGRTFPYPIVTGLSTITATFKFEGTMDNDFCSEEVAGLKPLETDIYQIPISEEVGSNKLITHAIIKTIGITAPAGRIVKQFQAKFSKGALISSNFPVRPYVDDSPSYTFMAVLPSKTQGEVMRVTFPTDIPIKRKNPWQPPNDETYTLRLESSSGGAASVISAEGGDPGASFPTDEDVTVTYTSQKFVAYLWDSIPMVAGAGTAPLPAVQYDQEAIKGEFTVEGHHGKIVGICRAGDKPFDIHGAPISMANLPDSKADIGTTLVVRLKLDSGLEAGHIIDPWGSRSRLRRYRNKDYTDLVFRVSDGYPEADFGVDILTRPEEIGSTKGGLEGNSLSLQAIGYNANSRHAIKSKIWIEQQRSLKSGLRDPGQFFVDKNQLDRLLSVETVSCSDTSRLVTLNEPSTSKELSIRQYKVTKVKFPRLPLMPKSVAH